MELNCHNCGLSFKRKAKKRNKNNFCSKDCFLVSIRNNASRMEVDCETCGVNFTRIKSECKEGKSHYCSNECRPRTSGLQTHQCKTCGSEVKRYASLIPKNGNVFCNNSCAGIWKNKNRDVKGTTRSKLEKWLEEQLTKLYPNMNVLYNDNKLVGMELDIQIPELKLAFEINGIFHYKDVFNNGSLTRRIELDENKKKLCENIGVKLIEVDSSKQIYFTEKSSQKYLDLIIETIDNFNITNYAN